MQIKIDHIAKIEGHAGFAADIANGKVEKAKLEIREGARLLEGILRSRSIHEVSHITSRICGVCPVVHNLTSLKAIEKALDVEVSDQTILLRKLMMMGQIINSHSLHLFFFSLSDFFGIASDLDLIKKFPQRAQDALLVRDFGNKIIEVIGGRSIHPLTPQIGGFTKMPERKKLQTLFVESEKILKNTIALAELFIKLEYPDFIRSSSYISLTHLKEYAFYDGLVATPEEKNGSPAKFLETIKEFQISDSLVKHSHYNEKSFIVGAIARLNHNAKQLNPEAKKLLKTAKIHIPSFNPFHNILAQAIEMVHCIEETKKLLLKILRMDLKIQNINYSIKAGKGAAAIEAPRGTLYYFYEIGKDGLIKECNIITPTAQNVARLEDDLKEYLGKLMNESNFGKTNHSEKIEKIKMLIRAYDLCLTCATH